MRIDYLCDHPELAPALAEAHVAAFADLLPDWTVDQALAELRSHQARQAIPTTLVALDDGAWLGSVSLLAEDHEQIRHYSPWLASLVVRPDQRGRGVGAGLVARAIVEATALAVPTLYLYCRNDLVDYYRTRGWRIVDQAPLGLVAAVVMAVEPAVRAP